MERFEIQPVLASALHEVASFVCRQSSNQNADSILRPAVHGNSRNMEARLRWWLLENPFAAKDSIHGLCVRDHLGIIRGVTLCSPCAFLVADRRLVGLSSGSFFVEPEARSLGFYLFKKNLGLPNYSFFYSTTCNSASAKLWEKLGGRAVANAEPEHILPLRLASLLPALLPERVSTRAVSSIARVCGRIVDPILRYSDRRSEELTVERSQDWPKLSGLFHRHRPKDWITTDRSPEFLQWRYGQNSGGVYFFRDKRGNEGWFALGYMARGRRGRIRGSVLLDAVWPREKMSFREILTSVVRLAAADADLISFRPRPGLNYGDCGGWFIRRKPAAPSTFVINPRGDSQVTASLLDLVAADGDGALPTSFMAQTSVEESLVS